MLRAMTAAATLCLLLASCSSAPAAPEAVQDRKNRAADYLKFGQQAYQEAKYDQAITFYQYALELNVAVDYQPGVAASWNSIATAQTALGEVQKAQEALAQAETAAQSSGDKTVMLQVAVNQVQAEVTAHQTEAARTRLAGLEPFPSTAEGAALFHALGMLEKDAEHWQAAAAAFDKALSINQSLNLKQALASNHFMKASVLGKAENWLQARVELETALNLDKTMENTVGIGQDWRALGTVATKLKDNVAALEAYERAAKIFQSAGLKGQQKRTLLLLVPVAEALGRTETVARARAQLTALDSAGL